MTRQVAVLGCGPAGLLCAHAVEQAGHEPVILSRKVKSEIPGSQYFHEPIPGVTEVYPENTVQYIRLGTAEGYAEKVYGDPSRPTGWENYAQTYPSWNVPAAYDRLWERFEGKIQDFELVPNHVQMSSSLVLLLADYDLVISTIPQQKVCFGGHNFSGTPFWIKPLPVPPMDAGRDIVIYNGYDRDPWYRWSILGGRCSIEYAVQPSITARGWVSGIKAGENDCDCWGQVANQETGMLKFVRAGRWAEWRHGVLLHHAYRKAEAALRELA